MKVFAYSYRDFDESEHFSYYTKKYGIEFAYTVQTPVMENAYLAEGYDAIDIITSRIDEDLVTRFHDLGVKMISTRTIGYDHIDIGTAASLGVHVGNATYEPNGVADYTVMLMLMAIRRMKRIMQRAEINDFSLPGIQGRELRNYKIGIIGTGKIGTLLLRCLSGFGCELYAYSAHENPEAARYARYVPLEELYRKCDMISLHLRLVDDTFHFIDREAFGQMKDGVVLINTARGGLVDSQALIEAVESGKVGAAALDVIENEFAMYYFDRKSDILDNRELHVLRGYPNVIVSPHMAWYTNEAVRDMVKHSLYSCVLDAQGKDNPWRVV